MEKSEQAKEQPKAKVVWDLASELMSDTDKVNYFLDNGYEPFAITPQPSTKGIAKPGELMMEFRIWMKKPGLVAVEEVKND